MLGFVFAEAIVDRNKYCQHGQERVNTYVKTLAAAD
jgi:hypothetical protein